MMGSEVADGVNEDCRTKRQYVSACLSLHKELLVMDADCGSIRGYTRSFQSFVFSIAKGEVSWIPSGT